MGKSIFQVFLGSEILMNMVSQSFLMPAVWCHLSIYNFSMRPSRRRSRAVGDREDGCSDITVQQVCSSRQGKVFCCASSGLQSLLMAANATQTLPPSYHKSFPEAYEAGICSFRSEKGFNFIYRRLLKLLYHWKIPLYTTKWSWGGEELVLSSSSALSSSSWFAAAGKQQHTKVALCELLQAGQTGFRVPAFCALVSAL